MVTKSNETNRDQFFLSFSNGDSNYKKVFQNTHFGFLLANRDFKIEWANPAFCKFTGYLLKEILLLTFRDLTHPEQIARDAFNLNLMIKGELPVYSTEKRYITKKGRIIWGLITVLPVLKSSGELVQFLVMVEDITARKKAEQEIIEWKNRYDQISKISGQAVYEIDTLTGNIKWGGKTQEVLGYSSKEINSITRWIEKISPSDRDKVSLLLERARKKAGIYECRYRFFHKTGRVIHIEGKWFCTGGDENQIVSMIGMMRDITEIISTQRELAENEERYKKLFDFSPSGIMLTDKKGNILDLNDVSCHILGYDKNDLTGRHISTFSPVSTREAIKKHLDNIQAGDAREREVVYIRKDGLPLNINLRETVIQLTGGELGILVILNDITSRKKAEQILRDSKEQLQRYAHHLQTIREEERARISRELHDHLGQYLSAIKMDAAGLINILNKNEDGQKLDLAFNQARQMLEVIDEIIPAVRKIASDLHPRVLDELGLIPGIEWLVEEFNKRNVTKCRLISSIHQINVGPAHAIAIFRIIQEALTNVIRHAKATKAVVLISENKKAIVVSIGDNGCGIKASELSSIKSLGLIGMYERALLLGGELNFRKNGKKGTRVILFVPKH